MADGFKYRERDPKTVKERATQSGGSFDQYVTGALPRYAAEAQNNIRILPWTWQDRVERWGDNWGIELWLHNRIGADKQSYLCLNKMKGKPCVICDARQELDAKGNEDAKKLRPARRVLVAIIDRDDEKTGPQAYAMPQSLEKEIQAQSIDEKTGEILPIDHPEEGFDVSFRKTGSGLNTDYVGVKIARESSPLSDSPKKQREWLDFIQDNQLPDLLKYYDNDYIDGVFGGKIASDDDDDDNRDRRGKKSSRDDEPRGRSRRDEEDDRGGKRGGFPDDDDKKDDRSARRPASRDKDDRGKDDGDDDRRSSRRGRDDDEDDKKSSRRPASRDEEDGDKRSSKRPASRDDDEDDKRSSKKSSRDDEDDDRRSSKRPAAKDDEKDEPKSGRERSRRPSADDDEPEPKSRRPASRRSSEEELDDEIPFKGSKRSAKDDGDDDGGAKASIERLRNRARKD